MATPTLKSPRQTKVFRPIPRIYRLTFHANYRYRSRFTFSSMKRSDDTSESGSTKERKKKDGIQRDGENANVPNELTGASGPRLALNIEDYGLLASDEDTIRLALAPQNTQNAMDLPIAGWPPHQ